MTSPETIANILRAARRLLRDGSPDAIALHPEDYNMLLKYKHEVDADIRGEGPQDNTLYGMRLFRSWDINQGELAAYNESFTEPIADTDQ